METKEMDKALFLEKPEKKLLVWPGRHGDLLVRRDTYRRADELATAEYQEVLDSGGSNLEAINAWYDRFMFYYKCQYEDL